MHRFDNPQPHHLVPFDLCPCKQEIPTSQGGDDLGSNQIREGEAEVDLTQARLKLEIRDLCSALAKGMKREREGLCSSMKRERQRKRRTERDSEKEKKRGKNIYIYLWREKKKKR